MACGLPRFLAYPDAPKMKISAKHVVWAWGMVLLPHISQEGEVIETPSMKMIDPGVSMVHFIVWKFIFIALTKLRLHGTPVSTRSAPQSGQQNRRAKAVTVRSAAKLATR